MSRKPDVCIGHSFQGSSLGYHPFKKHLGSFPRTAWGFPAMIYYFLIVPLDPAYKAGLAGHAPAKNPSFI
jgi:hypothetical protein